MWSIIVRSLMSWFPVDQSSPLVQMLHRVTDPIIDPIRRVMPNTGMIDLSPMMAIVALIVLQSMVAGLAEDF
jgi:YggT family protein